MAVSNESVFTISDCFITNKEKFLIYGEYCSYLLQAQDVLDNVCSTIPSVNSMVTVRDVFFIAVVVVYYAPPPPALGRGIKR